MDSLYFSKDEKDFFSRVLAVGLHQPKGAYFWQVARLAVAQSLRSGSLDGVVRPQVSGGSELHLEQVTGFRKSPDHDDAVRLLLSVHHQRDLWADEKAYVELLERHIRHGLNLMRSTWLPGRSFYDYMLEEIFADVRPAAGSEADGGAGVLHVDALLNGLRQINVTASSADMPFVGPRMTRYQLILGGVDDYDRLRLGLDDLAFTLGLGTTGMSLARALGERRVVLDVPRPSGTWRDVRWRDVASALRDRSEILPVCPGVDILGNPFVFDLTEAPHLFVAGATGSGKSVCVNALLLSLVAAKRPPELVLIDPKGVDFGDYDGSRHLRGRRVITDMTEAVGELRKLVDEMEERQTSLRNANVKTIAEAQEVGVPIERIVVVVDELADFMMTKGGAEEPLIRLAQKARNVGIHLLLATQRPEAATFPGLLRANILSRIALTVQKASDSRIILDEAGAENLLMRGDMLLKMAGRGLQRIHGARVDALDIKSVMQETRQ
ncbi:S-DNA-T family DNA segregation ATPase FtsK/SpoIIIE [Bosea sp. BE125]|uniref:FtsK/SpoIIIE domain-containing protein n=1 Tax=Bosea sp. BE125 TaxID=2817909 RepID=UPI00285532A9|nr:FtsK/SpoIIIE domain-containing protein [Bosea sp. BE125]MDR6875005.1 S-DNA-T family DNA segregation ATPase FtsK/SpoIIIE [Bosea sp. BE125]